MKLSVRSEYALRALIVPEKTYEQSIIRIQPVTERQRIPKRFLGRILDDLRAGGFVESRRGVAGGYRLARPPNEMTLAALIHYVEDAFPQSPIRPVPTSERGEHSDAVATTITGVVSEAREAMRAILEKLTLADLCERVARLRGTIGGGSDYVI